MGVAAGGEHSSQDAGTTLSCLGPVPVSIGSGPWPRAAPQIWVGLVNTNVSTRNLSKLAEKLRVRPFSPYLLPVPPCFSSFLSALCSCHCLSHPFPSRTAAPSSWKPIPSPAGGVFVLGGGAGVVGGDHPVDARRSAVPRMLQRPLLPALLFRLPKPCARSKGEICAGGFGLSAFGFLFSRLLLCCFFAT
jgi:hypothetical protein